LHTTRAVDGIREATAAPSLGQIVDRTGTFVRENFLYTRPHATLRPDEPLLARGIMDSVGVLELIEFLQQTFGVTIAEDEITEQNLGSLEAIARLVHGKCAGSSREVA
jgi:acyl carrier protein